MKITASQKGQAQAMKSHSKDIDLDIIWNHGIVTSGSPHEFIRPDVVKLKAAVRAQRKDYPKLSTATMSDRVAKEYANYCATELRRVSEFIAAVSKRDVQTMIDNASPYKDYFPNRSQEMPSLSWYSLGAGWCVYVLYAGQLVDYLRVAHPNLVAVWEKRIDPLVKKASDTQLPDGRSKLGNLYTPRIVSYLNSAANQIDVVRNALARIVEGISVAGQFKESEPKPRGRKRDDREPLREWIAGRNFQLPGMKSKRELAKIISRELETVRPKGVPLVGWSAVERVLERKETGIRWSQNQSKHSAKVRWPHLPHK